MTRTALPLSQTVDEQRLLWPSPFKGFGPHPPVFQSVSNMAGLVKKRDSDASVRGESPQVVSALTTRGGFDDDVRRNSKY